MEWKRKAMALNALSEISLRVSMNGRWHVRQGVEVKDKSILRGICGTGDTPEEAVEDHWQACTSRLKDHEYIVVRAGSDRRLAARWNGFMWAEVREEGR